VIYKNSKNTFTILGVINITPNSFSDGGEFNHHDLFWEHFQKLYNEGLRHFDIGAESTAPFNAPISCDEEIKRFKSILLPHLEQLNALEVTLSIDTYRPEVMAFILSSGLKTKIWWNDVSGIIDDQTISLLREYPNLNLIYCHNNVPSREKTSFHMDFVRPDADIFEEIRNFVAHSGSLLKDFNDRAWFDPCFGFAKTYQQNWQLLESLPKFMDELSLKKILIGVSRKSFLRKRWQEIAGHEEDTPEELLKLSEFLQLKLILTWKSHWPDHGHIAFRIHDLAIARSAFDEKLTF
jgi:dihydropteroate synthase